jgi:hypothetical protein
MSISVIQKIARKGSDKEKIAAEVIKNPEALLSLFEGIDSDKVAVRYGCEKILRFISEKKPELVYPHFDFFVKMLDSENNFLKWGAIITIANLTRVDKGPVIEFIKRQLRNTRVPVRKRAEKFLKRHKIT